MACVRCDCVVCTGLFTGFVEIECASLCFFKGFESDNVSKAELSSTGNDTHPWSCAVASFRWSCPSLSACAGLECTTTATCSITRLRQYFSACCGAADEDGSMCACTSSRTTFMAIKIPQCADSQRCIIEAVLPLSARLKEYQVSRMFCATSSQILLRPVA
jgi:hypothetical protein